MLLDRFIPALKGLIDLAIHCFIIAFIAYVYNHSKVGGLIEFNNPEVY